MEMREEHRKNRLALAIALDRSGSMAVAVKGGKAKMDLANLGTAEAIRMLSPGDSVAVIAVDSSPHVIQSMISVDDAEAIASKVTKIESMGGGIFVYEALVAAGRELMDAEQSTKHIILFSDANDSEEPGDYKKLLAEFDKAGITTSVIGLGTPTDADSKLLEDIAKLGNGNIMFTDDAEELPRLFTQDTMSVARSSFIKKDSTTQPAGIPGTIVPSARLMGEYVAGQFPASDGYNLSYLKPEATLGVVSQDEYAAPWSAFWYRGLGRVAAITLEVDGQHSGPFGRWDDYADFCITHGRWLLGGDDPDNVYLATMREGQDAVVTLELDPDRPTKQDVESPSLSVILPGDEREQPLDLPFQWTGPNTLQARYRLSQSGTYRTLVRLGGRNIVRGPAMTLPYSPEFMPRIGLPTGPETLEAIAKLTGGKPRIDVLEVLADPPRSARMLPLLPWLVIASVLILLAEIAGRRLHLWSKLEEAAELVLPGFETVAEPKASRWPWSRKPQARPAPAARPAPTREVAASAPPAQPAAAAPSGNVFDQAKRRARKRLNE
jgi:hypothetical protein